ncbi:hypothetical protein HanXRQr2_Chr12g0530131 [Helianthus annuus]|uniref:Uncharacterized protein n=1 Tax=Helianthus annuus TaxID=4232 RepID=A0A251SZV3_HELAN|nr:putative UPF0481 protein At3g02645 [Helianthus annuus]KAF5776967.1 hypothetical protein HanXRQr2_Chr12g0530131 [Helianthus annuus]KAJ0492138.1 hypothetical protein HanIR_Chr12g0571451 [Helianthus annuus]KAJ0504436.1 hypothetical protein HanHA89_Chr12g0459251 [Helianthus annuus]KAJ0674152.1 hypothetical protein HanLR1_Chr12g0436771 [Helianthus annuus]KAJ0861807.1 hypothetical protein HanPSC8_Chr12g0510791 [Helianthus annuus]
MASIDPSLISDPEEQKWVVEIRKILNHQLQIDVETPSVSLFRVPETITTKKPEAYEPQQIGLGPIHHFQPRPYEKMEQKKLGVIRKVLWHNQVKDFELTVLNKVKKIVPIVRSCYDMFLKGDDEHLAWIFAIDGLFLLNMFHTYNMNIDREMEKYLCRLKNTIKEKIESKSIKIEESVDIPRLLLRYEGIFVTEDNYTEWEQAFSLPHYEPQLPKVGPELRSMAQDVMMVENQVPFIVLKEIYDALHSSSSSGTCSSHDSANNLFFSPSKFHIFCKIHSPLKLCLKRIAPYKVDHLLQYMYNSIVENVPVRKPTEFVPECSISPIFQAVNFVKQIPYNEIVQAYEQAISILESFCQSEPVIPSASELHDKAGFRFYSLEEDQGVKKIRISGKDVYLPTVTLNTDSDVILRNLVAYETLTAKSYSLLPLTEFMFLMCALVVNENDVKRLENVIKGDLDAGEVSKLFTEMRGSLPPIKMEKESKVQVVIDEINKVYNSRLQMKPYLFFKKLAHWLLSALRVIGGFVGSSWKIVAFIVSIVMVVFLTLQAYCDVYGCNK